MKEQKAFDGRGIKIIDNSLRTLGLRKLIIKNPECELLIFCGEDANNGDYCYMTADITSCYIEELTNYHDIDSYGNETILLANSDYLYELIYENTECGNLTIDEFENHCKKKASQYEFKKYIVVYVG